MDAIDELLYLPGSFVCPECGFQLEKRSILARSVDASDRSTTFEIGIRKGGEDGGQCPNDGAAMERMTWKAAYHQSAESAHELMLALIESVKLQSHYAGILNDYDGGSRLKFTCPAEWIQRLVETGLIPERK